MERTLPEVTHCFGSGVNCIFSNDHLFRLQPTDLHYISSLHSAFEALRSTEML